MDKRKIYDEPELKITKLDMMDVITASGDPEYGEDEDGTGWV